MCDIHTVAYINTPHLYLPIAILPQLSTYSCNILLGCQRTSVGYGYMERALFYPRICRLNKIIIVFNKPEACMRVMKHVQ